MGEPGENRGRKTPRMLLIYGLSGFDNETLDPEWDDINLLDLLPQARRGAMFPNEQLNGAKR